MFFLSMLSFRSIEYDILPLFLRFSFLSVHHREHEKYPPPKKKTKKQTKKQQQKNTNKQTNKQKKKQQQKQQQMSNLNRGYRD